VSVFGELTPGKEKYPALTGVRAVGATVVFFDHFALWPGLHITVNVLAFFFALSGFLIVRIYYEQAQLRRAWLAQYLVNRFGRIYPVYFLLLTVAACLQLDFQPWILLKNYTLTHALFQGTPLLIQPSWSLTAEECFYLLAPAFMILARRYRFLVPFALGWLLLALALLVSKLGGSFLGTPLFVLSTTFFGHFVEFFAGVYLALAVMRLERREPLPAPGSWRTLTGLVGVSLLVVAMVVLYRAKPPHFRAILVVNNFLMPVPIAALYWGLLREKTLLSRLLGSDMARLLGRSSYSFYLMHPLVIDYVSVPVLLPALGHRPLCVLLTCIATWAASIVLFACYEEPMNVYIRRRFSPKSRPAHAPELAAAGRSNASVPAVPPL
jgi:peptidoglycan/LPS O-acetylase OafA/YrhL